MSEIDKLFNAYVETVNGSLLNEEAENTSLKVMLLGKESVGKTSFRNRLAGGPLPTDHIPTYLDIQFFHIHTPNDVVDLISKTAYLGFYKRNILTLVCLFRTSRFCWTRGFSLNH